MTEFVEVPVELKDIKEGDTVTLSHTGVVTSVNTYTGHVRLKDGARIRMEKGSGWDAPENPVLYTATRKQAPLPLFEAGQVWTDDSGTLYFVINGYKLKAYTDVDILVMLEDLAEKPGLRLVFSGTDKK
jgi:hypothetical protein